MPDRGSAIADHGAAAAGGLSSQPQAVSPFVSASGHAAAHAGYFCFRTDALRGERHSPGRTTLSWQKWARARPSLERTRATREEACAIGLASTEKPTRSISLRSVPRPGRQRVRCGRRLGCQRACCFPDSSSASSPAASRSPSRFARSRCRPSSERSISTECSQSRPDCGFANVISLRPHGLTELAMDQCKPTMSMRLS